MILDTSFFIDLMNGEEGAVAWANIFEGVGAVQRVPAHAVYELYVGVGYTETPSEEVAKIQQVIETRPIVETTEQIAKLAGRLDGQLRREGKRVAAGDILIGATARHFDEPVVTGNPSDFEPIPDVQVDTYRDREGL